MARILLLGGHGKVALEMTKLLAARKHIVTSVIRNPDHAEEIRSLGDAQFIKPLVASIEDTDEESAKKLMDGIDWIIWSAGAGGKGGAERTKAVDEIAAKRFISAALAAPSVTKYLTVSANCARKKPASYWTPEDIKAFDGAWAAIPAYCEAKANADEFLWTESRKTKKSSWQDICLRPGTLSDDPAIGKIDLGKAKQYGTITRADVAVTAVELLERSEGELNAAGLWIDMIQGDEPVVNAVERVLKEKITSRE
ncbi:hypothetical protein VNI00_000026 [Paramarasmius palmivorus]|uniref:NAD(P)-binding domain-containing protein n=1 Tax=Paramarasmius palmivorus TaxID=297713 RepID=A0AAW0EDP5_9AGAR